MNAVDYCHGAGLGSSMRTTFDGIDPGPAGQNTEDGSPVSSKRDPSPIEFGGGDSLLGLACCCFCKVRPHSERQASSV